jgi:hypothetical protein
VIDDQRESVNNIMIVSLDSLVIVSVDSPEKPVTVRFVLKSHDPQELATVEAIMFRFFDSTDSRVKVTLSCRVIVSLVDRRGRSHQPGQSGALGSLIARVHHWGEVFVAGEFDWLSTPLFGDRGAVSVVVDQEFDLPKLCCN